MKFLLRNTAIYAFSLYLLPQVFSGIKISGGMPILIIGGAVLTLMLLILKPVINIISIPLNLATLGLFSALTNLLILYLLTVFVPNIAIMPFVLHRISLAGFIIPQMHLGLFSAYLVIAIGLAIISSALRWVVE